VSRGEKDFLAGFEKAALLTQQILAAPPAYTSGAEYVASVAHLHADSEDLRSRGLAVGCLSALGRD
jgi:hypothetical protein